jgi:hypothetical protein
VARLRWIALLEQVLIVLASLALGAAVFSGARLGGTALSDLAGLFQWLWWLIFYPWIVALGVRLLRIEARSLPLTIRSE